MKKIFAKIIGTIGLGVLVLVCLVLIAPLPNQQNNGFERKWLRGVIKPLVDTTTNIPIEEVCGATNQHIYISTKNPRCLIRQDYNLSKFDSIFFPVSLSETVLSTNKFFIDSSIAYLFINNEPGIISGEIKNTSIINPAFIPTKQIFSQSTAISPSSVVIRTFDSLQTKQIFQKIIRTSGVATAEQVVFNDQSDRGFRTDGILKFDYAEKRLVYVQFYQNKFFVLDTNLVVHHQHNTIDTVFNNNTQLKQANIEGQDKLIPSKARTIVNKKASVDNGLLFVVSGLRADNEVLKSFNKNTDIDIYQVTSGDYLGSIRIPNLDGKKLQSFLIKENKLIALYQNSIIIYSLNTTAIRGS